MATASDNFNRADGGLGSNWTTFNNAPVIISNQASGDPSNNVSGASWNANSFSGDQFSQCVIPRIPDNAQWIGVTVRQGGGSNANCYLLIVFNNSGQPLDWNIYRMDGGSYTLLQGGSSTTTIGDVMRLEMQGNVLTARKNGVSVLTPPTDATYSSGAPGIQFFRNTGVTQPIDDWAGGDLSNPPVTRAVHHINTGRGAANPHT